MDSAVAAYTALIITFSGSTGHQAATVREAVNATMQQTPEVRTISGTGTTKLRVDGVNTPFTTANIAAIGARIGEKSKCPFAGDAPTSNPDVRQLNFTCPAR